MGHCSAVFGAVLAAGLAMARAAQRPNIIWIMSDDLGYGEVGAMPGKNNTIATPNIDRLFQSGATFTSAYAGEAVCAPSRGSLMTAKHTGHAYIRGNYPVNGHDLPLRPQDYTMAELLKENGYNTIAVGKWGMGWANTTGAPWNKGFNYYYGNLDQNLCHNMYPSNPAYTWDNTTQVGFPSNANASRELCMSPGNECVFAHDLFTNKALEIIGQQGEKERELGDAAQPLFMYLAYTDPHAGGWQGYAETGNPVPSDGIYTNQTAWPDVERDHAAVITYQDTDIGRILDALEAAGMRDNTLIAFASDNGAHNEGGHDVYFFQSSGPLRGFKRSLYEGGIRVPFGVSWPGVIPAGIVSDSPFAFWDVMPTVADLLSLNTTNVPADIDGVSVASLWLTGNATAEHPPFYWEFCTIHSITPFPPDVAVTPRAARASLVVRDAPFGDEPFAPSVASGATWGHAVRMGNWKAVSFNVNKPYELYDLSVDLGETNDVAASHPDIIAQMTKIATASHTDSPIFPVQNCVGS